MAWSTSPTPTPLGLAAVAFSLADGEATLTYTGCLRLSLAKLCTLLVCVALNSSVCLLELGGRCWTIASMVFEKPRSKIRSASSRTSSWRLLVSKESVWSMCCSSLPGVAMRIFMRDSRSYTVEISFNCDSQTHLVREGPLPARLSDSCLQ